jgi:lambda family phage tail tape measure protein
MASNRSLGSLTLDLIAKIGGFTTNMDKAADNAKKNLSGIEQSAYEFGEKIGDILKEVGLAFGVAFGFKALFENVKEAITHMDEMSKAAQRVGLSTESFSSLAYAAKLADVSTETLESSLGKLIKSLAAAQDESSKQGKIFAALGIATKDANGNIRSSEDVLKDFANRFNDLEGSPEAIAAGFELFGKSFQDIIPLLKDGAAGISDAQDEAKKLNAVIGKDAGEAAEQFNDNLTRLHTAVEGIYNGIAIQLLPVLEDWSNQAVELVSDNEKLDTISEAVTNALVGLAAIAHVVAIAFDTIGASIKAASNVGFKALDDFQSIGKSLAYTASFGKIGQNWSTTWKDMQRTSDAASQGVGDAWDDAVDGISSQVDKLKKMVTEGIGNVLPQRQLSHKADDFIDSIWGKDPDHEKRAAAINKKLHDVFGNADKKNSDAAKAADELAQAYAKLNEAVAKVNESLDPNQQAYAKYVETVRQIDQLGAEAIKKGGDVAYVQQQVAQAVSDAQKKLANDLAAPLKAAQAYAQALNEQLQAHKQVIDAKVQAIGIGAKEAANQEELARVYQEGVKAISDYQKAYEESIAKGKPNATPEQYEQQLQSLKDYWDNYYKQTKDGQDRIDAAQSDWMNGVNKAWQDFSDEQKNNAKAAEQVTTDFLNGASDAFASIVDGSKSASDAIKSFITDIESEITKLIAKRLFQQLGESIFGSGNNGQATSGNGSGGWMSGLGNILSSVFGGGRASGGSVSAGRMYEVNEEGLPEMLSVGGRDFLLMSGRSGRVTPAASAGSSSSMVVNNNFTFAAPTSMTTQTQVAQRQQYEIDRARRLK